MLSFSFKNSCKLIFGLDSLSNLEKELEVYKNKTILFLSSGNFIKDLKIYDYVEEVCNNLNIKIVYNDEVVPNPKLELARKLIDLCKKEKVDFILAAGGGSCIDTAKAVAVGAKSDIDVWKFYLYEKEPKEALPIGVISTIASSGSESSNASILSSDDRKLGIEYDFLIPKFAILNPQYLLTAPKFQLSAGIVDMSSHLIERYMTTVENVDTTDYMIEGMLKALFLNVEKFNKNPKDIDVLSEIFLISVICHNNLLDSGRISDWASHRIEHEISCEYGITHGEGMATILPAYIRYMAAKLPKKLANLAHNVFSVSKSTEKEMALKLADNLENIYREIGMRTKLNEFGIGNEKFDIMAKNATKNDTQKIGHYRPLDSKEMKEVLNIAL